MKKSKLISLIVIIAAVVVALSLSILFTPKEKYLNLVEFLEGKILTNDGGGYYTDGVDGVSLHFIDKFGAIVIDLNHSSRFVFIDFEKTQWKDVEFNDAQPLLKSNNYRVFMAIVAYELLSSGELTFARLTDVSPGYYYDDFIVLINLYDLETGRIIGVITRGFVQLRTVSGVEQRNVRVPPPELYSIGLIDFKRESETTWVLQGNTWFELQIPLEEQRVEIYYVKLSLKMSIHHEKVS
ncbi:MAG: hypothetical protein QXI36_04595 [Candidatus Bathyarchaeia archaeon]